MVSRRPPPCGTPCGTCSAATTSRRSPLPASAPPARRVRRHQGGVRRLARRRARGAPGRRTRRPRRPRLGRRLHRAPGEHPARPRALVGDRRRRHRRPRLRVARLRQDLADAGRRRGVLRPAAGRPRSRSGPRVFVAVGRPARPGRATWPPASTGPWPTASSPSTARPWTWGRSGAPTSPTSPPPGSSSSPRRTPSSTPTAPGPGRSEPAPASAGLEGVGHWWMLQDPAQGAEALARVLGDALGRDEKPSAGWAAHQAERDAADAR